MKAIKLFSTLALIAGMAFSASAQCDASFSMTTSGNTVAFSSTGNNANSATLSWSFGDGNYGSGSSVTHTYANSGTYLACFDVIDSSGNTCYDYFCDTIVLVNGGAGNGGGFSATCDSDFSWSYGSAAGTVDFVATGVGNSTNAGYYWNFGDGSSQVGANPSHTYAADGWYNACLMVIDSIGNCYHDTCDSIYIQGTGNGGGNASCDADFILLQDSTNAGLYYAWNNSTGSNLTYFWDFGDGNTSTLAYPTHTYNSVGTFNICLTVASNSCSDSICLPITVVVKASGTTLNVLEPGQVASVEDIEVISDVQLFPNPNEGNFNLGLASSSNVEATVTVSNLVGQVVENRNVALTQGQNVIEFHNSDIPSGVYLVNVVNESTGSVTSVKMMKK